MTSLSYCVPIKLKHGDYVVQEVRKFTATTAHESAGRVRFHRVIAATSGVLFSRLQLLWPTVSAGLGALIFFMFLSIWTMVAHRRFVYLRLSVRPSSGVHHAGGNFILEAGMKTP